MFRAVPIVNPIQHLHEFAMMAKSSDEPFNPASHYNSATFSDVQVEFSGKVTKAHRIFLCSRSAYFQKALGPESKFMVNILRPLAM